MSDSWPKIRVKRFYQEPDAEYARRRDEIVYIVDGFRRSRFTGTLAERMDARLDGLLSGDYDPTITALPALADAS